MTLDDWLRLAPPGTVLVAVPPEQSPTQPARKPRVWSPRTLAEMDAAITRCPKCDALTLGRHECRKGRR